MELQKIALTQYTIKGTAEKINKFFNEIKQDYATDKRQNKEY